MTFNSSRVAAAAATFALAGLAWWQTSLVRPDMAFLAGAIVLLVCSWGFRLLNEGVSALFFFLILALSGSLSPQVVFGGFSSSAFWLIFAGLVIGRAVRESGLSRRLAHGFRAGKGATYSMALARVILVSILFSLFIPSAMGRIVIMLPILKGVAEDLGFTLFDSGFSGIMLAGVLGTYLAPFSILPANLPNIVMAGAASSLYGVNIGYVQYGLLHFPVMGLGRAVALFFYLRWMFPATIAERQEAEAATSWTLREKATAAVICLALVGWMLDSVHGVSPGWVGLGAALLLLLPIKGWYGSDLLSGIRLDTLLFAACAIGLGGIIRQSGLGNALSSGLLHILPLEPGHTVKNVVSILGLYIGTQSITLLPSMPSVQTPLAMEISKLAGMPLLSVIMLQPLAFGTVLLPYQGPPLVVAMYTGGIPYNHMLRACLVIGLFALFVLVPLDMLWWRVMGLPLTLP